MGLAITSDKIVAGSYGQPIIASHRDRVIGARTPAIIAEEAPAQIDPAGLAIETDRICRTRFRAFPAIGPASCRINGRRSMKAFGEFRRIPFGIGHGAMALPQTREQNLNHDLTGITSQIMSAIREVEAFVAEWEIGDLLAAQRIGEPEPVVKGRINNLVTRKPPPIVRQSHMTDFASPAFDK